MKLQINCDFCGKPICRYESNIKTHNFCSRNCLARFSNKTANPNGYASLKDYSNMSKHLSEMNRQLNPSRMTEETRTKIRQQRMGSGQGKTYSKLYGRHTHRVVAEQILGRPLQQGEVVHHVDGNKQNNQEWNLLILPNQSEHAKLHIREKVLWEGGDAG